MEANNRQRILDAAEAIEEDAYRRGAQTGFNDCYRKYHIQAILEQLGNVSWNVDEPPRIDGEYLVSLAGHRVATTKWYEGGIWKNMDGSLLTENIIGWAKMPRSLEDTNS